MLQSHDLWMEKNTPTKKTAIRWIGMGLGSTAALTATTAFTKEDKVKLF
jgi:hypothetical protein